MTLFHRHIRLLALPLAGMLAACAHDRAPPLAAAPPPPKAAPVLTHDEEIAAIAMLLDGGHVDAARTRLAALLAKDPTDSQAKVLEEGIDGDPVELLGPKSFAYTVAPGDTMASVAEHFLGNRLKSYLLARYNGIAVPGSLAAGLELKIPGNAPEATLAPARPAPRAGTPRSAHGREAAPAMPARSAPAADPAAAVRLRAAGLASLNAGQVDRAVALLGRAAAIDPANPLVARDLARARRIQGAVHARR